MKTVKNICTLILIGLLTSSPIHAQIKYYNSKEKTKKANYENSTLEIEHKSLKGENEIDAAGAAFLTVAIPAFSALVNLGKDLLTQDPDKFSSSFTARNGVLDISDNPRGRTLTIRKIIKERKQNRLDTIITIVLVPQLVALPTLNDSPKVDLKSIYRYRVQKIEYNCSKTFVNKKYPFLNLDIDISINVLDQNSKKITQKSSTIHIPYFDMNKGYDFDRDYKSGNYYSDTFFPGYFLDAQVKVTESNPGKDQAEKRLEVVTNVGTNLSEVFEAYIKALDKKLANQNPNDSK